MLARIKKRYRCLVRKLEIKQTLKVKPWNRNRCGIMRRNRDRDWTKTKLKLVLTENPGSDKEIETSSGSDRGTSKMYYLFIEGI